MLLDTKTAVVYGAGGAIGSAVARAYAREGAEVHLGGRTRTTVRPITGEERTEEVARMLSGAKLTDTSRKHAEQMLKANA